MIRIQTTLFFSFILLALCLVSSISFAAKPITTDSRIKTLVYNENEVFRIIVHYGYQSSIEFAKNEEIQTLSLGDSYSWKITPVGNRIFIKALTKKGRTNMTLITNKRSYHFDIISRENSNLVDQELVYVARFFYPDEHFDDFAAPQPYQHKKPQQLSSTPMPMAPMAPYSFSGGNAGSMNQFSSAALPPPYKPDAQWNAFPEEPSSYAPQLPDRFEPRYPPQPRGSALPLPPAPEFNAPTAPIASLPFEAPASMDSFPTSTNNKPVTFNYNYSLTGPDLFAPLMVFDDGEFTYFSFPDNNALVPDLATMSGGREIPLITERKGKFIAVRHLSKRFVLRANGEVVNVYNDS